MYIFTLYDFNSCFVKWYGKAHVYIVYKCRYVIVPFTGVFNWGPNEISHFVDVARFFLNGTQINPVTHTIYFCWPIQANLRIQPSD